LIICYIIVAVCPVTPVLSLVSGPDVIIFSQAKYMLPGPLIKYQNATILLVLELSALAVLLPVKPFLYSGCMPVTDLLAEQSGEYMTFNPKPKCRDGAV
jgi:hypothetical protein